MIFFFDPKVIGEMILFFSVGFIFFSFFFWNECLKLRKFAVDHCLIRLGAHIDNENSYISI